MLETVELTLFYGVLVATFSIWLAYLVDPRIQWDLTQIARRLLWVVLTCHFIMFIIRYYRSEHLPILSAFEFVNALAFLILMSYLLFSLRSVSRYLGLMTLPIVFILLGYAWFLPRAVEPEIPIFQSLALKTHVTTCLIAYSLWALTFAGSLGYLVIKDRKTSLMMDRVAYRSAFFAFCFLTIGIVTGALWADKVWGSLWSWDPKETWSFITWLIFLAYLHARYNHRWRGVRAAVLGIVGFFAVGFTYIGVDFLLPKLHSMGMNNVMS